MTPALLALALFAVEPHLGTLALESEGRPVLDGRLVVRVPASTADAPGAKRNDDTRLVIDAGQERLEIHASELFSIAGDDFAEAATRVVRGWGREAAEHVVAPFALPSGLRAVEVVPATPLVKPTGAFVRGMFVASPDGSAQYLEARVNALGARDFAGADKLATAVLRSASAGAPLALGAASLRLVTPDPLVTLFADAPARTAASVQRESDRAVHRFQPVVALGENAPSLTLTLGRDARYMHDRLARSELKVETTEGKLFGKKVLWHAWSNKDGTQHLEAIVTLGDASRPLTAHILVLHRGDSQAMVSLAETLRLERRPSM